MRAGWLLSLLLGLGLFLLSPALGAAEAAARPNFILIMADDLGYAGVGCFGSPHVKTPHIDRLAREGMRLTDFHSSGAVCSPTRAGLLTGRYQQRTGVDQVINADDRHPAHRLGLQTSEITFARLLKKAGYATGIMGKWHLGYTVPYNPLHHGFDRFRGFVSGNIDYQSHLDRMDRPDWWHDTKRVPEKGYSTHLITEHSLRFIEDNKDRPFCLYVAHEAIHSPAQGPDDPPVRGPNKKKNPTPPAKAYQQMTEEMDRGIGAIRARVEKLGLAKNTLIFFFSDNGGTAANRSNDPRLRGAKGSVWEGGHRVPAVAWWPGHIEPGTSSDALTISLDIMPTLLALARAPVPEGHHLDGIDLSPVLLEGKGIGERTLFWEHVNGNGRRSQAMRQGAWKLVQIGNKPQLFHLGKDLGEKEDLSEDQPDRLRAMSQALQEWQREVRQGATKQPVK
jgi:arylsulfatase A